MNGGRCFVAILALLAGRVTAQTELTGDSIWEYRTGNGVWSANVPAEVAVAAKWPSSWRTFTRWEFEAGNPPQDDDPAAFTNVPSAITLNGVSACRASLPNYGPGVLDLTLGQGAPRTGLWAYVFGSVKVDRDQEVTLVTAASGHVKLWLDGKPVTTFVVRLSKGEHLLAGRVESGEREWNLAGCFLPAGVAARRTPPPPVNIQMPVGVGWPTNALARGKAVTIGLVGDPQSGSPWRNIAHALSQAKPDLLVIIGDLVVDGLSADGWNRTFFAPGANVLTNVPCLAVLGNHDRRSPLFDRFGGLTWTRDVGGALLVGVDGGLDWSPGSEYAQWLEKTLAGASNQFKFVVSHYPAYSSRTHGKLAGDGRLLERSSRVARTQLMPLLEKYNVTAMFSGHDHGYERSELPGGLTAITTAGGGAGVSRSRPGSS